MRPWIYYLQESVPMIEQFYFPNMKREEEKQSDRPNFVSHSPFMDEIEKGFLKGFSDSTTIKKPTQKPKKPSKEKL